MSGTTKKAKRGFAALDREKARKDARPAVKVLRRILKDARADLSVPELACNRLDHALDLVEEELNDLLPAPGSRPSPKLPFDDDSENGDVPGRSEADEP